MKKRKFVFFSFTYKHTLRRYNNGKANCFNFQDFFFFFWIFCLEASKLCVCCVYLYFKMR